MLRRKTRKSENITHESSLSDRHFGRKMVSPCRKAFAQNDDTLEMAQLIASIALGSSCIGGIPVVVQFSIVQITNDVGVQIRRSAVAKAQWI